MRAERVFWRMDTAVLGFPLAALILSAHMALTSPLMKQSRHARECKMCPPGEYQKSCDQCEPCPAGTYMPGPNHEGSCQSCFRDCRPDYHLKVVEKCTNRSNVKCICETGFKCTDIDQHTNNCRDCAKVPEMTTNARPDAISLQIFRTLASATLTTSKPCRPSCCATDPVKLAGNSTERLPATAPKALSAILCPLMALGLIVLVVLFRTHHPEGEACFKRAIINRYKVSKDASPHTKESTYHNLGDPSSPKHPPCSLAATNLGPVHVHNTGTVIFSLLSQITGQADPARAEERGRTEDDAEEEEEEERDCPVFHPTPSPCSQLSQEEKGGERVFFPFQEQGKDSHMSKEEVL